MLVIAADGVSEKLIFAEIAFLLYCRIVQRFSPTGLSDCLQKVRCSGRPVVFCFP